MAFCSNHERIYFDTLCRTKKAETLLSLIHATYQVKINSKQNSGKSDKELIAEKLEHAYELFKFDSGSYSGSLSAFESQYTIGHEMGIWQNSDLDLTPLATKVAEGNLKIKDYFSVVFLNYIQPVKGKIVHILHCLLTYMHENNLSVITKEQMAMAYESFIPGCAPQESVNSVFNFLVATDYFKQTGKQELTFNSEYDIKDIINLCDVTYLDETKYTYEQVKEKFKNLDTYLEYLLNEHQAEYTNETKTGENIFDNFAPWLTSYNNPDYTGTQKYSWYPQALLRLVAFMKESNLIEDSDLNDLNIEKYEHLLEVYDSSEEVREFDEKKLSSKAGGAALKKYIKYIEYLLGPKNFDFNTLSGDSINKIFFGTPGCGKSYYIEHDILGKDKKTKEYVGSYKKENIVRTTFYQDYSNTDFVGQILPKIVKGKNGESDTVQYIFNPGPFTLALIRAISNPGKKVVLVVEEINRGNAPAIFGDIFQLLDRDEDGISEYGIVNVSLLDYLNDYDFIVDGKKKRYVFEEIKIPGNMDIFATMNTSDQNVYTLDTAFVRRWDKEKIENSFKGCNFASTKVPGMDYTWQEFVTAINNHIAKHLEYLQVNEDKQIGVFFVKESLLGSTPEKFAYKVFDYLWSDVAKLDHGIFFNHFDTLEALITAYEKDGVGVFKTGIFDKKETPQTVEEDENNE